MTIAAERTGHHERHTGASRLGYRIAEWSEMTGTSRQTTWRAIRIGALKVVDYNGIKLIPRTEAVRLGLITLI
jgi:hypothetical protein